MSRFERSELILGEGSTEILQKQRVIVFGVGGVGSYAVEALARGGIGEITVVDSDKVSESNINRQLIATRDTIGCDKVDAVRDRVLSIDPRIKINAVKEFARSENLEKFCLDGYSYIIDAIDTVSAKIALAVYADERRIPIISSMGTGNKLDPTAFEVSDIYKTSVCPLARVMRYELRKRGVSGLKVVWSKEEPIKTGSKDAAKRVPGSVPFVPGAAGLIIAGEVIKDILNKNN